MKLVFIGDHFYRQSSTMMSSIYTEDGHRSDWGKVQLALTRGENVEIRQANAVELSVYNARLARWNEEVNKKAEREG